MLLEPEDSAGESFCSSWLPDIVRELSAAGIAVESDGALVVYSDEVTGPDDNPVTLMVRKKGATTSADSRTHFQPGTGLPPGVSGTHQKPSDRVLYVITCATPAARDIGKLVALAQAAGWTVCVIATPLALRFIDQPALEARTGYPVRSECKQQPSTPDVLPPANAIAQAPGSFGSTGRSSL